MAKKVQFSIEGMHCGSCATGIQMLVSQMEGAGEIFVDYKEKKGSFEYDTSKLSKDDIIKAIAELGYQAS